MIVKPYTCTKIEVWYPKYSTKYSDGEYVALLHTRKVQYATPVIVVEFTKAKHLKGQRFAIKKVDAMKHEIGDNGSAPMYIIPLSHFEPWETPAEVRAVAMEIFYPERKDELLHN